MPAERRFGSMGSGEGRCRRCRVYRPRRAASAPGSAATIELSGSFRHGAVLGPETRDSVSSEP